MFNNTYIDNSYKSPSKIEVVEKKAPTDDSIRLLGEMQQKAFDSIVDCFQLSNNDLNDITCWIYPDHNSWSERARIRFKLNEKEIDFNFKLPCKYTDRSKIVEMIQGEVLLEISKQITNIFIEKNIKQLVESYSR